MEKRLMRRAVVVAAVAAVAVGASVAASAAPTAPALAAASSPKWRITQTVANLTVGGLWAGGARDAWVAGDACADPATCGVSDTSNGTVVVRHWDGTAWRAVTPPKAYINSPLDQGAGPVVATSASNAWIFAGRGAESVDYTDALHWTGKGWAKPVSLNTSIQAAVAPSAADIWAFGTPERYPQTGYVAHFNGKTWTHGTFPIAGQAAGASSATDIWVGGVAGNMTGPLGMEHWDGRSWHATPLPGLGTGPQTIGFIVGIAAIGPRDAWADASTYSGSSAISYLLHWNGSSWTRTTIPYGALADSAVVPDGHGGLWLAITIGTGRNLTYWFCHYSGGHWTKTPIPGSGTPAGLISVQIAWIPGTRSLWATGDMFDSTAIFKYGP
jgi:hypothetical protein